MDILEFKQSDNWITFIVIVAVASAIGLLLKFISVRLLIYYSSKSDEVFIHSLKSRLRGTAFLFIPLIAAKTSLHNLFPNQYPGIDQLIDVLIITSITILVIRFIFIAQDVLFDQYDIAKEDNLKERKARTQIIFLRKIGVVIVAIIGVALVLLSFDSVRNYGATILTSAGVAGIIIGFAAQKTLSNLLAGIQIAFTQPIRLNDAVVVENEWGWIEEINLTFVVVKIWDQRRLVLPITYFTDKPFQNWTKEESQILGSVMLYMDYTIPLEPLRKEFERLLTTTSFWDKHGKAFQVTDSSERTITIRMLMTAKNSPEAWELRCYIREHMLTFIQTNYPESLPRTRAVIEEKSPKD